MGDGRWEIVELLDELVDVECARWPGLLGSTDARLVLSQRRRLAGGSWAGLQGSQEREKKGVERKPVMRSARYVKGKRSEGPGSQEAM